MEKYSPKIGNKSTLKNLLLAGVGLAALEACTAPYPRFDAVRQELSDSESPVLTSVEKQPEALTVFSKNVNGVPFIGNKREKHKAAVMEFLASDADIGLFQEVIDKDRLKLYQHPDYHAIYGGTHGNYPWNYGGLVILSRKKPSHSSYHTYEEQGRIFDPQITDRAIRKGYLSAFFEEDNLAVVNTHLLASYGRGAENNEGNKAQLQELIRYLKKLKEAGWELIVGGDFNFSENDPQYHEMSNIVQDHTRHLGPTSDGGGRIDYIWDTFGERNHLHAKLQRIDNLPDLSDHRSVIHRVLLEPRDMIESR